MPRSATTALLLKTLLVSDLVGSTQLVEKLGDREAAALFERHDRIARDLLAEHGGHEIDKTDGFLLLFDRPVEAVLYALSYHRALRRLASEGPALESRVGIHLGEVVLWENSPEDVARGAKPVEVEGLAKPMAARLMSLAAGGQTLLTRGAFDLARRGAVGEMADHRDLSWLAHGGYLFKGVDEPTEVFEVGAPGTALLEAPGDSEKVRRALGHDAIPGWRPATGLEMPRRSHWVIERKLGEGGFGEVWLAAHRKTGERRVFKFCYEAGSLHALKREITLFRLLKEVLGERDDIARILDWSFDRAPYFIESEYTSGGDLVAWAEQKGGIARVPLATRLEIVARVAEALAAAHSVGVLHKDVKPANILVRPGGDDCPQVRLADFGVGRVTDKKRLSEAGITVLGMTRTAATAPAGSSGTPLYLAPELLEGRAATLKADLYALGVMLYQMVVGDLRKALGPGWERGVGDPVLRADIAAAVDASPTRRLGDASMLARRLRSLEQRRAESEARQRVREEAERTRAELARSRRRGRLLASIGGACVLFGITTGLMARRIAREAERAELAAARARNLARVALAGEWFGRDPTRAALVLLEVEQPEETPLASSKIRQAIHRELALLELRGHRRRIQEASWSPDGSRIATASHDGTARVWPADGSGTPVVLEGHGRPVVGVSWSPDGSRVATASDDGTARVWPADGNGAPVVLEGHGGRVLSASWSPDGQRLVTASADRTARVWPADGRGEPVVLEGHEEWVMAAEFSPTGERVVTGSGDGSVRVWPADGRGRAIVLGAHDEGIRSASWSRDGQRLVTASADGTVRIWPAAGAAGPVRAVVLRGHEGELSAAWWSPDGSRILSASYDRTARIWSADGSGEPLVLRGHGGLVRCASWSPDGTRVVTGSGDGTARVWDAGGAGAPLGLRGHGSRIFSARFDPGGTRVVTGSGDGSARVWAVAGPVRAAVLPHDNFIRQASWSPDGEWIATASWGGSVRVWSADGSAVAAVFEHAGPAYAAWFSPDGARLLTASTDGTARVWPADGSGTPVVLEHDSPVGAASWSPDGRRVVTSSSDGLKMWPADGSGEPLVIDPEAFWPAEFSPDGTRLVVATGGRTARVWSADGSGEPIELAGHRDNVRWVSWSPDGERIATASWDGTARIWRADGTGAPMVLEGHRDRVECVAWSPDGEYLVTASRDRTARVWPADGSGAPAVLEGHQGAVYTAIFSPDGRRVLTASEDRTVRVWWLDTGEILAALRAATQVCLDPEFRRNGLGEEPAEARARYAACERAHGREPPAGKVPPS